MRLIKHWNTGNSVCNNGCGMDAITLRRVFEPLFTTKAQGKGTGMGMAVLFGIVQRHEGTVRIDSEPGNGTCVKVFLPKCREECSTFAAGQHTSLERGTERIMFVDDEIVMAEMARNLLTDLGYTVNDAFCALKNFRSAPESFDLVDSFLPDLINHRYNHAGEGRFGNSDGNQEETSGNPDNCDFGKRKSRS